MSSTRTNLYKNPSFSYNKDLSLSSVLENLKAYNVATANTPAPIEQSQSHSIHQHKISTPKRNRDHPSYDLDGPLTHQNFIQKRRKEIGSSAQFIQELSPDILGKSNSSFQPLVQYESDESTSSEEHEDKHDAPSSDRLDEIAGVKRRSEQRFPAPGEPVCVVCGKYGEYICDVTGDDVCSINCKTKLLKPKKLRSPESELVKKSSSIILSQPEPKAYAWDFDQRSICPYKCWKCNNPGHLAEDCLVSSGAQSYSSISRDLRALYRRCHQIGKSSSDSKCNTCQSSSSLSMCLDCSTNYCDSSGHLHEHIVAHPSHRQLYSYKLQRLVKCCKSTCDVTDINDLLSCHYCIDKAFEKFYDMYTATWKRAGISIIWNSICCEEHFSWHRMNCMSADVEGSAYVIRPHSQRDKRIQLSDFIF